MNRTRTSLGIAASTRSAACQGLSTGFMNSWPSKQAIADRHAVAGLHDGPIAADRFGRQVGRLDDVRLAFEHRVDFLAAIDVIAERDGVDAGADQLAIDGGREAGAAGGVLGVGDDEVELVLGDEAGDGAADDVAARFADDVADEEECARVIARVVRRAELNRKR